MLFNLNSNSNIEKISLLSSSSLNSSSTLNSHSSPPSNSNSSSTSSSSNLNSNNLLYFIFNSFLDSQSHSSIWRRNAEIQLYSNKLLSSSSLQSGNIHTSSLISSYFVLLKAIIGGGIFTLPYAISKCGYIFGLFLMLFTCFMTIIALHLLARCSQKIHPISFYTLAKLTMPKAVILIDWAISLGCIGTGIAYLMIIGSLLPEVMLEFGLNGIWLEKQLWVSIAFAICAPICYFHHISAFKWTSLIADVSIVFVVLIILLYSIPGTGLVVTCPDDTNCRGETVTATLSLQTLKVLGIFVGVFSCSVV